MNIIKLNGEDPQLYSTVAHLVMNEKVLAYNLGYPFKTSSDYLWFIAAHDNKILGFMPVKMEKNKHETKNTAKINNYYIANDEDMILSALLKEIIQTLSIDCEIESVTQTQHIPVFEKNKFSVIFHWKRYAKMKVIKNEKECL